MYHMYKTYYYLGYSDIYIERRTVRLNPEAHDELLQHLIRVAKEAEIEHRRAKAIKLANAMGIDQYHVIVEPHEETLDEDGPYMRLVRSAKPAVLVMDSMSMYLHQLGLSYWITLLRTTLQHHILPITVEEYEGNVHLDFDNTLRNRLIAIEALTSHIKPEPKRIRGRRKLGPISDVVCQVLADTANKAIGSSDDVMDNISRWYDRYLLDPKDHMHQYAIFDQPRWKTYKYKVRSMIRKMLEEYWNQHYPDLPIQHDIWQTNFLVSGQQIFPAVIAAEQLLPEFGYEKIGSRWAKLPSHIESI